MIKIIGTLLLIFMLALPDAFAQEAKEMRIEGNPKKLENGEMVARRDQNGNYCAALQVIADMSGFSFERWDGDGNVEK